MKNNVSRMTKWQTLLLLTAMVFAMPATAQWTTSGNDIYNSNSGNVGIGTSTPAYKLEVNGTFATTGAVTLGGVYPNAPGQLVVNYYSASQYSGKGIRLHEHGTGSIVRLHTINNGLYLTTDNGTAAAMTLGTRVNPGDASEFRASYGRWEITSGSFSVNQVWTGNGQLEMTLAVPERKGMIIRAASAQTANLFEWQNSSGSPLSIVNKEGSIGIGTTNIPATGNYKLAVGGSIIAEKVRVKLQSSTWPDYVFHYQYPLMSLKEVENFIAANSHLPGVPAASEVEKEGLDLGDGQTVLLKKIEELTLYIIDINKRVEQLQAENEELKKLLPKK